MRWLVGGESYPITRAPKIRVLIVRLGNQKRNVVDFAFQKSAIGESSSVVDVIYCVGIDDYMIDTAKKVFFRCTPQHVDIKRANDVALFKGFSYNGTGAWRQQVFQTDALPKEMAVHRINSISLFVELLLDRTQNPLVEVQKPELGPQQKPRRQQNQLSPKQLVRRLLPNLLRQQTMLADRSSRPTPQAKPDFEDGPRTIAKLF